MRLGTLYGYFAQYPYLRRLKDEATLHGGVRSGLDRTTWQTETFAYAESFDTETGTYKGLVAGPGAARFQTDLKEGLLVRPDVALAQIEREADARHPEPPEDEEGRRPHKPGENGKSANGERVTSPDDGFLRVKIDDPTKLPRVAAQIGNDIVAHLATAPGIRQVEVTIEVKADACASPSTLASWRNSTRTQIRTAFPSLNTAPSIYRSRGFDPRCRSAWRARSLISTSRMSSMEVTRDRMRQQQCHMAGHRGDRRLGSSPLSSYATNQA